MTQITATRHARATARASALRPPGGVTLPRLASTGWKATVLVVLAVAVIGGILAMHSFASSVSHSEMAMSAGSSTSAAASHHEAAGAFAASSLDCVGCGEDESMAVMWCVLALLTVSLLLVAPKLMKSWAAVLSSRLLFKSPFRRLASFVSRPPSLTVLCISRT
ncbi:DUF6153 family protein [Salinibacterium sp. PAMC 21357]|uniref:DUF6153 family protein n=1 Tax=Salinibacterium sp. PAMC 21357 TaxID=1112215 RepID=UPI0002885996|nr:DUF6153 family protein [Salinibacterium sp. PAMC 21357]